MKNYLKLLTVTAAVIGLKAGLSEASALVDLGIQPQVTLDLACNLKQASRQYNNNGGSFEAYDCFSVLGNYEIAFVKPIVENGAVTRLSGAKINIAQALFQGSEGTLKLHCNVKPKGMYIYGGMTPGFSAQHFFYSNPDRTTVQGRCFINSGDSALLSSLPLSRDVALLLSPL